MSLARPPGSPASTNLPSPATSFIGRAKAMAEVKHALASHRLVTLTGAGGCGKTRLGLRVSETIVNDYPDGVWWVELAALSDPLLVPNVVASSLPIPEQLGPAVIETLCEFLTLRQALLILDNCEHLVEACALLAERLLRVCPNLQILATSREPLNIPGEKTWLVPSLTVPDPHHLPTLSDLESFEAIRLFAARAADSVEGFTLNEQNARAVAHVCHRLDGIPLAIEMAAARMKLLTVKQIAERLDDALRLLSGGGRTLLPRHRTLRAAMDWSYHLLSAREQALLRRLSVFAGSFTLEAAEAVASDSLAGTSQWSVINSRSSASEQGVDQLLPATEVLDLLAGLLDKSLVSVMRREEGQAARYRLLETVRQYAAEKLDEMGETDRFRSRHYDWCFQTAEHAHLQYHKPTAAMWLDQMAAEHDNLRAALDWLLRLGDDVQALQLAHLLVHFWDIRGHSSEGRVWIERALAVAHFESKVASPRDSVLQAEALGYLGRLAFVQSDFDAAKTHLKQSIELYRDLARSRALGDDEKASLGHAFNFLGFTALHQSDYAHARVHFEEALALYRSLESPPGSGVGFTLSMLARVAIPQAQYDRAARLGEESVAIGRRLRHVHLTAAALDVVGRAYYCEWEFKGAQRVLEESLALSKELGHQQDVADTLNQLGLVAYYQGEYRQAINLAEEALAISQTLKHRTGHAKALSTQAEIALAQGDLARARTMLLESLTLFQQLGMKLPIVRSLEIMGTIEAGEHQAAHAVRLLAAAEALREALGAPLPPPDRPAYARALASAREQLGKRAFAPAWDEGRALNLDQAVDLALAASGPRLSARQAARQQFGGLSQRERQVAGLLAQGKTNRQIADELVVELSTVEGHVTNILAKLGFSSRAQVAVWAVAKGLGRPPPE